VTRQYEIDAGVGLGERHNLKALQSIALSVQYRFCACHVRCPCCIPCNCSERLVIRRVCRSCVCTSAI
jgi:hypothetical protein